MFPTGTFPPPELLVRIRSVLSRFQCTSSLNVKLSDCGEALKTKFALCAVGAVVSTTPGVPPVATLANQLADKSKSGFGFGATTCSEDPPPSVLGYQESTYVKDVTG